MKYWTTKEVSYIQKNALLAETNEVINIENIAKKLGRSVAAVSKKSMSFAVMVCYLRSKENLLLIVKADLGRQRKKND